MLDAAQSLIVGIGLFAAFATFVLLRNPSARRAPYRAAGAFSLFAATISAIGIFGLFLLMAWLQRSLSAP